MMSIVTLLISIFILQTCKHVKVNGEPI